MATGKNDDSKFDSRKLACGLGWFSVTLGLAQLLAPRRLGRALGVGSHPVLMRLLGFRELASGLGLLTQPNPSPSLKARVAGDVMDLALLGAAVSSPNSRAGRIAAATAAVAGVTALDVRCSREFSGRTDANIHSVRVRRTVTIGRSAADLYQFWRHFENLPRFMNQLESVQVLDEKRSHWTAKGPAGTTVEWDSEIIHERENAEIAWRSLPGSQVGNAGFVRFEPAAGDRGTIVRVEFNYDPPAGTLGAAVAKLFGKSPQKQLAVELLRFKQLMETGEIARTEGQPAGRTRSTSRKFDDFVRAGV